MYCSSSSTGGYEYPHHNSGHSSSIVCSHSGCILDLILLVEIEMIQLGLLVRLHLPEKVSGGDKM